VPKFKETSDAKKGGLFVGKSHADGGIPAVVTDTGQEIEVEGGEAIINKAATKKYCKELSKINQSAGNGVPIPCVDEVEEIAKRFNDGGKITLKDKKKIFDKWRKLVNMTHTELRNYYNSKDGQESGLSKEEADEQGISSGRESATWILKMKKTNWKKWSNDMWRWANKQISFISRMRGNKGDLFDEKGKRTPKLKSLLIWGHNPKKFKESIFETGGKSCETQEKFDDGGKTESNELIALHNIRPENILDADKIGGLITPSIAIIKPEMSFTQYGSITLIADKNLIDPKNKWDVKVFAGDIYSPSVPRKLYNFDKKRAEKEAVAFVTKAYSKNRSLGNIVDNSVGTISRWYKDLGKYSSAELQKNYFDDFKIAYLLDKGIDFNVPEKNMSAYMWNNMPFVLSPKEKTEAKKIYEKYRKNEYTLNQELQDEFYDIFLLSLNNYLDQKAINSNPDEELREYFRESAMNTFEKVVGTKGGIRDHVLYNLQKYLYPQKEIDTDALKKSIDKAIKPHLTNYKNWLNDFMDQWQGSSYFEAGREKRSWTMENLVDATTGATRGQEDTLVYGVNKARSFAYKQFSSIEEIKQKSDKILSADEVNAIQEDQKNRFFELAERVQYKYSSQWDKLDDFSRVLADYFKGMSIGRALSKNGFTASSDVQDDIQSLANEMKNSPVDYFEAKLQKGVPLSEFKYAVVPKDVSKEVVEILKNNDIKISKYFDDEQRSELISEITKKKKLRFETGGLFHGTKHKFDKFSLDSIGTGEGSQAFGWGLYFTSLKDIAQWYAQTLGDVEIKKISIGKFVIYENDIPVGYDNAKTETETRIAEYFAINESEIKYPALVSQSKEESQQKIEEKVRFLLDEFIHGEFDDYENDPEYYEKSIAEASALKKQPIKVEVEANKYIYNVTYNKGVKKPDVWLRWDKPLMKQDQAVQDAISKQFSLPSLDSIYPTAGDFYQSRVTLHQSDEKASKELLSIGIDGIKYPAESRSEAEARGFNYVVFDDSKLSIDNVNKYEDGGVINPEKVVYVAGGVNEFDSQNNLGVQSEIFPIQDSDKNQTTEPIDSVSKGAKDVYEAGNLQVRNVGGELTYYKKVNKRWEFLDQEELSELKKGQKHELEHNSTMKAFMRSEIPKEVIASSIAWEHIQETPDYYEKLEKAIPEQKAKGDLIKRADGSYSQRGLWDNVRENIGSGKEPTVEMLEQEAKIKAEENNTNQKDMFSDGGKTKAKMESKGYILKYTDSPVNYRNVKGVRPETFSVSPYDKKFNSICKPFLSNDEIRPILSALHFEGKQAVATDAHKLIHIVSDKAEFNGNYPTDVTFKSAMKGEDEKVVIREISETKYVNWSAVIRDSSAFTYEIDTMKLYQYCKVAINYVNKPTYQIAFKYDNDLIGFNGKYLIECLETIMKIQKCPKVYVHIDSPSKAMLISYKKSFSKTNDTYILLMPVMLMREYVIENQILGAWNLDMNTGIGAYFDFSKNAIFNSDGTIANYQETYDQGNEMPSGLIAMFGKMIDKKSNIYITQSLCVNAGEIKSYTLSNNGNYTVEIPNDYNIPDGMYSIVNNGLQLNIGVDVDDFPNLKNRVNPKTASYFTMKSQAFKYYFDQCVKHAGKDDLRPVMQGIYIDKKGDTVKMVSTDGWTICQFNISKECQTSHKDFSILLSNVKAINEFLRSVDVPEITIYFEEQNFRIDAGRLHFQSTFIEGKFPNYEAIIPETWERYIEFNLKELMACLKSEELKAYAKDSDAKIKELGIFNVGNKVYIKKITDNNSEIEQICSFNMKFNDDGGVLSRSDSQVILMPVQKTFQTETSLEPTHFYFNIELLQKVIEAIGSDTMKAYYRETNKPYTFLSDNMNFKDSDVYKPKVEKKPTPEVIYVAPTPKVVYKPKAQGRRAKFNVGDSVEVVWGEMNGKKGIIQKVFDYSTYPKSMKPDDVPYYDLGVGKEISESNLKLISEKKETKKSEKDLKDALAGAKAYLKYATGKEKKDIQAYIRGLEILLK